ncbi:MAG: protein phosphatase CheZ [Gammaproteobacteria bacterium]|nr:protein phosphatase CheZ [Gammaproteobacteria bacterium]
MSPDALEQAKRLVEQLEAGNDSDARRILDNLNKGRDNNLFSELGKLTRELHEALNSFQLDSRIAEIAGQDIPDAQERLQYVIKMTEQAANRTMDAIERSLPLTDSINQGATDLLPTWEKVMHNPKDLQPGEFKDVCSQMDDYLKSTKETSGDLHSQLTEVLMAQDYQDLTGQVIRRVITLVKDVEDNLVRMIRVFGASAELASAQAHKDEVLKQGTGPVINPEVRDDVVKGQDDVDDLLSSLGF